MTYEQTEYEWARSMDRWMRLEDFSVRAATDGAFALKALTNLFRALSECDHCEAVAVFETLSGKQLCREHLKTETT